MTPDATNMDDAITLVGKNSCDFLVNRKKADIVNPINPTVRIMPLIFIFVR